MHQELLNDYQDDESIAVPLPNVREAFDTMPYASVERVMFGMLVWTGCRISELDRMRQSLLMDGVLRWHVGKNQRGLRKEILPPAYLQELQLYRQHHKVSDQLFGISSATFRRYFNRDIRPKLPPAWREKHLIPRGNRWIREFILQLKGLRKTFASYHYAREYLKWNDAGLAIDFTRKRMRHSKTGITAYHYVKHFERLGLIHAPSVPFSQAVTTYHQTHLSAWRG